MPLNNKIFEDFSDGKEEFSEEKRFLLAISHLKNFESWRKDDSISGFTIRHCSQRTSPVYFWLQTPTGRHITFIVPHWFESGWNNPENQDAWYHPEGCQDWRVGQIVYAGSFQAEVLEGFTDPVRYWVKKLDNQKLYTVFPWRGIYEGQIHRLPNGRGPIDESGIKTGPRSVHEAILASIKAMNRKRR